MVNCAEDDQFYRFDQRDGPILTPELKRRSSGLDSFPEMDREMNNRTLGSEFGHSSEHDQEDDTIEFSTLSLTTNRFITEVMRDTAFNSGRVSDFNGLLNESNCLDEVGSPTYFIDFEDLLGSCNAISNGSLGPESSNKRVACSTPNSPIPIKLSKFE